MIAYFSAEIGYFSNLSFCVDLIAIMLFCIQK